MDGRGVRVNLRAWEMRLTSKATYNNVCFGFPLLRKIESPKSRNFRLARTEGVGMIRLWNQPATGALIQTVR